MKIKGKTYYTQRIRNSVHLAVVFFVISMVALEFKFYPITTGAAFLILLPLLRAIHLLRAKKEENRMTERLRESGIKYDAEYHSTEKTGFHTFRIKVVNRNPLSGEEKYFYSTELIYDPKIFIPDITKISVYVDHEDAETYFIDFHGAIVENEAVYRV